MSLMTAMRIAYPPTSIVQLFLGELEGSVAFEVRLAAVAAAYVIDLVVTLVVELHVLAAE